MIPLRIWKVGRKMVPSSAIGITQSAISKIGLMPKPLMYDLWAGERIVEYTWVSRNINVEAKRVLDVGCWGSLFSLMLANTGLEVWGLDIRPYYANLKHTNFRFVQDYLQTATLPPKYFDVVIFISSIEHSGLPDREDFKCIQRARELLKENGEILLTVPYGDPVERQTWGVYGSQRLHELFDGFDIVKIDYFIQEHESWIQTDSSKAPPFGKGLACVRARNIS